MIRRDCSSRLCLADSSCSPRARESRQGVKVGYADGNSRSIYGTGFKNLHKSILPTHVNERQRFPSHFFVESMIPIVEKAGCHQIPAAFMARDLRICTKHPSYECEREAQVSFAFLCRELDTDSRKGWMSSHPVIKMRFNQLPLILSVRIEKPTAPPPTLICATPDLFKFDLLYLIRYVSYGTIHYIRL